MNKSCGTAGKTQAVGGTKETMSIEQQKSPHFQRGLREFYGNEKYIKKSGFFVFTWTFFLHSG